MSKVLIDVGELAARLRASDVVVLEVGWHVLTPDSRIRFDAGRIGGSVFVSVEDDLAAGGSMPDGRMPLPLESDLTRRLREWGISRGDTVVVVDDIGSRGAARAWWLLRHAGIAGVRILDGGLAAWRAARMTIERGAPRPPLHGTATAHYGGMPTLSIDDVTRVARAGVLLDARDIHRYSGDFEPLDPRAGHIPGAVSAPTRSNLQVDGRFLSLSALHDRFTQLGVVGASEVAVYCGSGMAATHEIAALAIAGIDASLYTGSWSQWSARRHLPIVTGPNPR